MGRSIGITATALLILASCGGSENEEATANNAADAAAPTVDVQLQPGQWEVTVETVDVQAPSMPQEAVAAMRGQKNTDLKCLTPEQVSRATADFFTGDEDSNCDAANFSAAGGRISGTMTCTGGEDMPGDATIAMDGRYSAESYDITQTMTTGAGQGGMQIRNRLTGRRVGECSPDSELEG